MVCCLSFEDLFMLGSDFSGLGGLGTGADFYCLRSGFFVHYFWFMINLSKENGVAIVDTTQHWQL